MAERGDLAKMSKLIDVQRARRRAAETALATAQAAERSAQTAEEGARRRSYEAQEQWSAYLAGPSFAPEASQALSKRVIDSECDLETAAGRTREAGVRRARRQHEWQMMEAQLRSSEDSLRRQRRKARRREEEKRAGELADRTTYAWCRR